MESTALLIAASLNAGTVLAIVAQDRRRAEAIAIGGSGSEQFGIEAHGSFLRKSWRIRTAG